MSRDATTRRRGPRRGVRTALLSAHITISLGLLGADSGLLALTVAGQRGAPPVSVYPAAHMLGQWLLQPLAIASVVSGIALGLATRWGVFRYWWTLAKLALNLFGVVMAELVLLPALQSAADQPGTLSAAAQFGLVRDTGAAIVVLLASVLLASYKPFGRLSPRPSQSRRST